MPIVSLTSRKAARLSLLALLLFAPAVGASPQAPLEPVTDDPARPSRAARFDVVAQAAGCVDGPERLCLHDGRFAVEVEWRTAARRGIGRVAPLHSNDAGVFSFFRDDNWELLVKVLDGCDANHRFWVFAAASTDLAYTLRVTDTASGLVSEYRNPLGRASPAITDTRAFATCDFQAGEAAVLIFANPDELFLGGEATVTVVVRDAGGLPAPAGTRVRLTADLGDVEPEVLTGAHGEARARFVAGRVEGTAVVTALVDGHAPASVDLRVRRAERLPQPLLFASPDSLVVGEESTITVILRDRDGFPSPGERVRLIASAGVVEPEVVTDASGEAQARFVATTADFSADVVAVADGRDPVSVSLGIDEPSDEKVPRYVDLFANPKRIYVLDEALITVLVRNGDDGTSASAARVRLLADLGIVEPEVVTTDAHGFAEARLIAGDQPGQTIVTGITERGGRTSISIDVDNRVGDLDLGASSGFIEAGSASATVELIARVIDARGEPFPNQLVHFRSPIGTFDGSPDGRTDGLGEVRKILRVDSRNLLRGAVFIVRATTVSGGRDHTGRLTIEIR